MERQRARLAQGQGPEVVHEPSEDPGLFQDRPEMDLVGRVDAIEDRLDVALDDGERRPELVGHVGEQAASLGLIRLEPCGHRVEAAGEVPDRVRHRADRIDPGGVVARLDARCLFDQVVEDGARAPDGAAAPDEPGHDRDQDEEGGQPDQRSRQARCVQDVADEPCREGEDAEDPRDEQEPEQAAEAAPRASPLNRRPGLLRRPPRGPRLRVPSRAPWPPTTHAASVALDLAGLPHAPVALGPGAGIPGRRRLGLRLLRWRRHARSSANR